MARLLSILLVLGLLGGTAAAFAITEGLKLERSPITRTRIENQLFSPVCDCAQDAVEVTFLLRKGDALEATVVTRQGQPVATIANHYFRRGTVDLSWNGRDSTGNVVPDGAYKLRLHLRHQTITLPNLIRVSTKPPSIVVKSVQPRIFSPDHDGRAEYVSVSYSVSAPARALLYVNGRQVGRGRIVGSAGSIHWFGGEYGPGVYQLTLRAEDQAGNVSPPTRPAAVRLRYLTLRRSAVHVRRGKRFAVRVSSDAKLVHWLLRGKSGEAAPGTLVLRAPKKAGRYTLFVSALGHSEAAAVVVSK